MRKPSIEELDHLAHSAYVLHEWSMYQEYVARFYPAGATKIEIGIDKDLDDDGLDLGYSIREIQVFAGEMKLNPDIDKVNLECPDPPFKPGDDLEGIMEFLDGYVDDLPIPFRFGNVASGDNIKVDITHIPERALIAQRIWLEDAD